MWQEVVQIILLIYVIFSILVFFFVNSNIIPMRRYAKYTIDIPAEMHYFDNGKVAYWKAIQTEEPKNVILLHGFTRNSGRMNKRAKIYWDLGYNVYLVDNMGHGNSANILFPSGIQFSFIVRKFIKEMNIKEPILHGASMGAIGSSYVAQKEPELCKFIICEALAFHFDRLYHEIMAYMHFPFSLFFWVNWLSRKIVWRKFVHMNPEYNPTEVSCPMFLIHGEKDGMFKPQDHYVRFVEEMKDRENFEHWLVEGSAHTRMDKHPDYEERLIAFVKKYEKIVVSNE